MYLGLLAVLLVMAAAAASGGELFAIGYGMGAAAGMAVVALAVAAERQMHPEVRSVRITRIGGWWSVEVNGRQHYGSLPGVIANFLRYRFLGRRPRLL